MRGLLGRANVDRLIADIDSAFDAYDAKAAGEQRPDVAHWYMPIEMFGVNDQNRADKRKAGSILAVESPPALFDLIEILNEEGLGELAA